MTTFVPHTGLIGLFLGAVCDLSKHGDIFVVEDDGLMISSAPVSGPSMYGEGTCAMLSLRVVRPPF
jgi:cytochrome c biogenesis protein ResB